MHIFPIFRVYIYTVVRAYMPTPFLFLSVLDRKFYVRRKILIKSGYFQVAWALYLIPIWSLNERRLSFAQPSCVGPVISLSCVRLSVSLYLPPPVSTDPSFSSWFTCTASSTSVAHYFSSFLYSSSCWRAVTTISPALQQYFSLGHLSPLMVISCSCVALFLSFHFSHSLPLFLSVSSWLSLCALFCFYSAVCLLICLFLANSVLHFSAPSLSSSSLSPTFYIYVGQSVSPVFLLCLSVFACLSLFHSLPHSFFSLTRTHTHTHTHSFSGGLYARTHHPPAKSPMGHKSIGRDQTIMKSFSRRRFPFRTSSRSKDDNETKRRNESDRQPNQEPANGSINWPPANWPIDQLTNLTKERSDQRPTDNIKHYGKRLQRVVESISSQTPRWKTLVSLATICGKIIFHHVLLQQYTPYCNYI